ncbi:MAG TPA: galactokinase family protein, partial [Actinomycetota bacterium]|nr:galactokinase family protein [Actinomycetota bacterium]
MARVQGAFRERTGSEPEGVWAAPGRVNLIGDHTDHNDGFVLPLAIDRQVVVAVSRRDDAQIRAWSLQEPGSTELRLETIGRGEPSGW